jgi:hypothetical protein
MCDYYAILAGNSKSVDNKLFLFANLLRCPPGFFLGRGRRGGKSHFADRGEAESQKNEVFLRQCREKYGR